MILLILAAGLGNRYGGTKQFDGVGPQNEFLLEYTIFDAITAGFRRVVLVTRMELVQEISKYFEERLPNTVHFQCIPQSMDDVPDGFRRDVNREKPWGTAHAVWCARKYVQGKFVMVNADDLYGSNAIGAAFNLGNEIPEQNRFGLVAYKLRDTLSAFGTVSRGVCHAKGSFLAKIREYTKLAKDGERIVDNESGVSFEGDELVSMNLWVLDASIFLEIEKDFRLFFDDMARQASAELYVPNVIQRLIDGNAVLVQVVNGDSEWHGMTYKEDKAQLATELEILIGKGMYPAPLWS